MGLRVTRVPLMKLDVQLVDVALHFNPAGSLVISPFLDFVIFSANRGNRAKTGVTRVFVLSVKLQMLSLGVGQPIHL
jgi:hypothetical protein